LSSIYDSFQDTGCRCVTGIEIFLDPRNYSPASGIFEAITERPINFDKFYTMVEKQQKEEEEANNNEDVSLASEQKLELVVQGTELINKGYTRIAPYQLNTCILQVDSLDSTWLEADSTSVVFTHSKLDESLLVPIYFKEGEHSASVVIPNDVLIPGDLSIGMCIVNSDGTISSTVTNTIKYLIYPVEIKPIDWGKITNFDLYYHFISTVVKLLEDFQRVEEKTQDLETIKDLNAKVKVLSSKLDEYERSGIIPFGYKSLTKIQDYLYDVDYDAVDYEAAIRFLNERYSTVVLGACSCCTNNGFYARNYDCNYDDCVSFIVHTPNREGRYKVIGIAGSIPALSKDIVESRTWTDFYKYLPMVIVDGINEKGLAMNVNIVPVGDYGYTTGTKPDASVTLCAPLVVRYILDHCASIDEAVDMLKNKVNIFCPNNQYLKNEMHYMLYDGTNTVIVEFINNKVQVITCDNIEYKPIMTNFHVFNTIFEHGSNTIDPNTVTDHGMGVERYNILAAGLDVSSSLETIKNLIKSTWYTKAYSQEQNPIWLTELVEGNLTVKKAFEQPELFTEKFLKEREKYLERTRHDTDKTWQTVHTSIYDVPNRKLYLIPQEGAESITLIERSL